MTTNKLKDILETFRSSSAMSNIQDPAEKERALAMVKDLEKTIALETKKDEKTTSKFETEIALLKKTTTTLKELEKTNAALKAQVEEAAPILAEKKLKDQKETYKDIVDPEMLGDAMKLIDLDEKDDEAAIKTKLTDLVKNKPLLNLAPKSKDGSPVPPKLDDPHHPTAPRKDKQTPSAPSAQPNPAVAAIFGSGNLGE